MDERTLQLFNQILDRLAQTEARIKEIEETLADCVGLTAGLALVVQDFASELGIYNPPKTAKTMKEIENEILEDMIQDLDRSTTH